MIAMIILWKYWSIKSIFKNHISVSAEILSKGSGPMYPAYGLNYMFEIKNKKFIHTSVVMQTKIAKQLGIGSIITVLVDPDNPNKSEIFDVYRQ
jgi:hypothetical protein